MGVDVLATELAGDTSVISGPSGVGKSTLLNALSPGLDVRTGEVSEKTSKGKHTTAVAVRYEIGPETFVIDTPGIREIGLWNLEPDELYGYFDEMLEPARECRFPNCLHDHEPGCGVRAAVEDGVVTEVRFSSYLNMLESLRLGSADRGR
jgi:ribosome biogenesis GTPase